MTGNWPCDSILTMVFDLPQQLTKAPVSVADSKAMIIEAATSFDAKLGAQVKAICDDEGRFNIRPVEPDTARMMRIRKHGLNMTSADDQYVSAQKNGAENWTAWQDWEAQTGKPAFTLNHNEADKAQIDYEHDGTAYATALLAHEIGHALADDQQMASGYGNQANPKHMQEVQAYTLQHIVMDYMANHPDPAISQAGSETRARIDERHLKATDPSTVAAQALNGGEAMTSRGSQYLMARGLTNTMATAPTEQKQATMTAIMGGEGPKNIAQVFGTAGLHDGAAVTRSLNDGFKQSQGGDLVADAASKMAGWLDRRQTAAAEQKQTAAPTRLALG